MVGYSATWVSTRKDGGQARRLHGSAWSSSLCLLLLRGVGEQGCHSQFREKQAAGLCSRQDLSFPSSLRPGSACSCRPTGLPWPFLPHSARHAGPCSTRSNQQRSQDTIVQIVHARLTPSVLFVAIANDRGRQRKAGFDGAHHSIGVHRPDY